MTGLHFPTLNQVPLSVLTYIRRGSLLQKNLYFFCQTTLLKKCLGNLKPTKIELDFWPKILSKSLVSSSLTHDSVLSKSLW